MSSARDVQPSHTGPGDHFIDMGGQRLATNVSGAGPLTVVLETGLGAESAEWQAVQTGVESFARVFRYDRAGRGASDPAPTPRSAMDMVRELRSLLDRADISGPYVVVGHSYGGLLARLFAYHYPQDVVGLVLADSMHEDQFDVFGPMLPAPMPDSGPEYSSFHAFWTSGWREPRSTIEGIDFLESQRQGHEIVSLGGLPLRVLVAGTWSNQPFAPPAARGPMQAVWAGLQNRLASLSSRATVTAVDASGHFVQRDDPGAVIAAIRSVVEEVQTG